LTVLVTGAAGFLGRAVVAEMLREGIQVRAAVRRAEVDRPAGVDVAVVGDLESAPDLTPLLANVDAIVHCAARVHVMKEQASDSLAQFRAVNTAATLRLASRAAEMGVRRFVFVSTIGVNGSQTFGRPFTASSPPAPHSPYAVSKYEAEQGLLDLSARTGLEVVIIRPPLILGPDPKGNLAMLAKAVDRGWPMPFALVTRNRRDLTSLSALGRVIRICVSHPRAAGQVFLVSDGKPMSTRQIVESLAVLEGRSARLFSVPPPVLSAALKIGGLTHLRSQLLGDLEIDIAHTRSTLGWSP
jgi:nucleoside-diphosphate-sugar epimerase